MVPAKELPVKAISCAVNTMIVVRMHMSSSRHLVGHLSVRLPPFIFYNVSFCPEYGDQGLNIKVVVSHFVPTHACLKHVHHVVCAMMQEACSQLTCRMHAKTHVA